MTETQPNVSKARLNWKDFPKRRRARSPIAEPDRPFYWGTRDKSPQLMFGSRVPLLPIWSPGAENVCVVHS